MAINGGQIHRMKLAKDKYRPVQILLYQYKGKKRILKQKQTNKAYSIKQQQQHFVCYIY